MPSCAHLSVVPPPRKTPLIGQPGRQPPCEIQWRYRAATGGRCALALPCRFRRVSPTRHAQRSVPVLCACRRARGRSED